MKTDLHHYDHNLIGLMKKLNGCVHILSGRVKCLKISLESFYKYYNYKYDYPVYVYYFDPLYTDDYINDIHSSLSSNIHFIELDYSLPKHINKSELFIFNKSFFTMPFCFRMNHTVSNILK